MGIYIKGMEMPTSCGYCWLKYFDGEGDCCPFIGNPLLYSQRPNDCPLVPVPPHGRLIDADKFEVILYHGAEGQNDTFDDGVRWLAEKIDDAPTIIEAEEET